MSGAVLLLAFVTAQRLAELVLARRNTARLLARGGVEAAPGHYPLIVLSTPPGWRGSGSRAECAGPVGWLAVYACFRRCAPGCS